jgi:hypothetical protein
MVVALPFRYDLWSSSEPVREEDLIDVHCLIPNGSLIPMKVLSTTTLFELKEVRITEKKSESCTCEVKNNIQCVIDVSFSVCYRTFSTVPRSTIFKIENFFFVYDRALCLGAVGGG